MPRGRRYLCDLHESIDGKFVATVSWQLSSTDEEEAIEEAFRIFQSESQRDADRTFDLNLKGGSMIIREVDEDAWSSAEAYPAS